MIRSIMTITHPIHITVPTIHGVTVLILFTITTAVIMVTDIRDTIPGTPATVIPHTTTAVNILQRQAAGEDTAQCQEDHTPQLTQGPSQAMLLQVK